MSSPRWPSLYRWLTYELLLATGQAARTSVGMTIAATRASANARRVFFVMFVVGTRETRYPSSFLPGGRPGGSRGQRMDSTTSEPAGDGLTWAIAAATLGHLRLACRIARLARTPEGARRRCRSRPPGERSRQRGRGGRAATGQLIGRGGSRWPRGRITRRWGRRLP